MIKKLIQRPITTSMIFLGICLIGIISLNRLSVQLLPDIDFPKLTVITPYENTAPSEIETLVTKHIEEAVSSVNGVLSIHSETIEGLSLVTARFDWGTNMDLALIETKEKVDLIKGQLPQETGQSLVVKFDPRAEPVLIYSFINKNNEFKNLRRRIEKEIVPYLERIKGVALVDISGGYNRQINIDLDSAKIFSHNLSLSEIMEKVDISNYNFPAGYIEKGNTEYLVRTIGEFKNLEQIKKIVVGTNESGVPVYLGQIASINDSFRDRKTIIRCNGNESVALLIRKEPGKNTVRTCQRVTEEIDRISEKYNSDFTIREIYDQSDFIESSVGNVLSSAIIGGLIAIFILWFFLNDIKSPLIIATSIPVSIIGTFGLMYFKGITLNTMSLGGLALAVGMMVDSGIVVLESITKKKNELKKIKGIEYIIEGTNEVLGPVVASTMTTIVVFLPIVFLSGLSGAIFGELALTISFALLFSLISSVTLIPMLYSISWKRLPINTRAENTLKSISVKASLLSDLFMDRIQNLYERAITKSLNEKKKVLSIGAASLIIGIFLFIFIDSELMPRVDPGEFTIDITMPQGTTLTDSSTLSGRIENLLLKKSYVKNIYAKIGSDPDENIAERTSGRKSNNILIKVLLKENRSTSIRRIVQNLKNEIRLSESVTASYYIKESVIESIISRRRKPIHVEIYGNNFDVLKKWGKIIKEKMSAIENIKNITSLFDRQDPELKIEIDRNRIASMGVSIANLAGTIKAAIQGEVATRYRDKEKDEEIDIRVRFKKSDRTERDSIFKILVKSDNGSTVPVMQFTSIVEGFGSSKIIRAEQSRINVITGDTDSRDAIDTVREILASLTLPDGYEWKIIGEMDEAIKVLKEMRFALILAIILIYMLLASQFQSLKNPLIIMLSIPVASLGISGSLFLTGKTLNINSGIGIIMLAGIVVNNAIVLFDYIELERLSGKDLIESIRSACLRRLKPILMTTLTTICALLPIALGIGEGSELQQPMAIAVIGGLTVSTFLTLIFIPTTYAVVHGDKE